MRPLSDTITRLANFRGAQGPAAAGADRLVEFGDFGTNPGSLRAKVYIPDGMPANAPLVVVMHGCTQTAEDYNRGAGWSTLADREGFALLFPEQVRSNNSNLCFNWFDPADTTRGQGEVQSIAQMVENMLAAHSLDRAKVFVTGLSAGGAMTSAMLATYPELFAGGAIIAGLPYACAAGVLEAFDRMRGHGGPTDAQRVASVKNASAGFRGPWPSVSIWHGTADATVSVSNMAHIGQQWRGVHGVDDKDCDVVHGRNWQHRTWARDGRPVVEEWSITGMGHGTPIDGGTDTIGVPAPYVLAVGVSSTEQIARSWGIVRADPSAARAARPSDAAPSPSRTKKTVPSRAKVKALPVPPAISKPDATSSVQSVIESALRAAGLMR